MGRIMRCFLAEHYGVHFLFLEVTCIDFPHSQLGAVQCAREGCLN